MPDLQIDAAFPGGNILVKEISGDDIHLEQDLRDTFTDWFYWCFRIRNANTRTLHFHFPKGKFAALGPACSQDERKTWNWLFSEPQEENSFTFTFSTDEPVYFSMGMPYTGEHLERFLQKTSGLEEQSLCLSKKQREVKLLSSAPDANKPYTILLTARHHCCEMMANYEMEGILEAFLSSQEDWAKSLRGKAQLLAVPFMDRDGVEDGDQGKNRKPHDHNRDYGESPIHLEVAALQQLCLALPPTQTLIAVDLHCPYITGNPGNEDIFIVGGSNWNNWIEQQRFSQIIEKHADGLPFDHSFILPHGKSWNNTDFSKTNGSSCGYWMAKLPNCKLGTTIELPYALAGKQHVTAESARQFGRSLPKALAEYLDSLNDA